MAAAPDATAQLVQLCQSKSLGMFNQDDRCVRDIHANFNDGRGDQQLNRTGLKISHHRFFFNRLHASMQQADTKV